MRYSKYSNGIKQCPLCGFPLKETFSMEDTHKVVYCTGCDYKKIRKVAHAWEKGKRRSK